MEDFITTKQLCEWLNISENTAYNWRKAGKIPYIQMTKKTIKYDKLEVQKWIDIMKK